MQLPPAAQAGPSQSASVSGSSGSGSTYHQMQTVQLTAVQHIPSGSWDTYGPQTPADAVQQVSPNTGGSLSNLMKAVHIAALSLTPTKQTALPPSDMVVGHQKKQPVNEVDSDDDGNDEDDDDGDASQQSSNKCTIVLCGAVSSGNPRKPHSMELGVLHKLPSNDDMETHVCPPLIEMDI